MKRIQPLVCRLILGIGCILFLASTSIATDPPTDPHARPLSDFLTENGIFQNSNGYSGPLNPEGFSLSVQNDGTPVFMDSGSDSNDNWEAFSDDELNGFVRSLLIHNNILYVSGGFNSVDDISANGIARFDLDTHTWKALGDGIGGGVNSMVVLGDFLYVGGYFEKAGDKTVRHIARYNLKEDNGNSSWNGLASVHRNTIDGESQDLPKINVMIAKGDDLIVGGRFGSLSGTPYSVKGSSKNSIAKFNTVTETWSSFGNGLQGYNTGYGGGAGDDEEVIVLALLGDYLYVSGDFYYAGLKEIYHIARYNLKEDNGNPSWSALADEKTGHIKDMVVKEDNLIIAANFLDHGESTNDNIGLYNTLSESWHIIDGDIFQSIYKIDLMGNILFVGGYFSSVDNTSTPNIAKLNLDSEEWSTMGDGVNGSVYAFATSANDLYVGGKFTKAGGKPASYLAQWNEDDVFPEQIELIFPKNKETNISLRPELDWLYDPYVDGYIIMVSETNKFSDPIIHHENVSSSSYEISEDLEHGETYYWRVRGSNEFGNGAWSNIWSFTTKSAPTPNQVTLLSPDNNTTDIPVRPELAWQSTEQAEYYELVLSEHSDLTSPLLHQTDIEETIFQISQDLHFDKTYYWHVRGVNEHGEGDWSETWSFTTVALPDQVSLSSPANGSKDIQLRPELNWQTADETDNYEWVLSQNSDFSDPLLHQTDLIETSVQISEDLDYSTTYYWHVRGVNEHGNGLWSETWSFTTIPPPMPEQVALLTPANNSSDLTLQPELSWEAAGETQSYELILSTESDLSNPVLQETELQETAFQLSDDLDYSQTYYWQVRGVNMYGEGSWSEVWSFTTIAPTEIALEPNWPNPFSKATSGTTIRYRLPEESDVHLDIFDISGRRVAVLVNETKPAGQHDILFNGSGLADGVYFYRLVTGTKSMTRKMLLLK